MRRPALGAPSSTGAIGLALVIILAACSPSTTGEETAQVHPSEASTPLTTPQPAATGDQGTLRRAISEPDAIIPPEAGDAAAVAVVDAMFDSLTAWNVDGEVLPAVATSWSSEDDDARQWTFRLRPDARYHDGLPVVADDFVASWSLAAAGDAASHHLRDVAGYDEVRSGEATELDGVVAVNDRTLRVNLVRPHSEFPAVVGHPALGPVPRARYERDPDGFREQPVGNGPFAADEPWARGRFLRLTRSEQWAPGRRGRPAISEVLFQFQAADDAYLAFQQGRIDVTPLPVGALAVAQERADTDGASEVLTPHQPTLYYLGMDLGTPPFDDVAVRRAISLAIDRTTLAEEVLEGNVVPARSVVPPALPGARRSPCSSCRFEPDLAEQLFAERGVDEVTLWFNRGGGHERVAQQVREDLAAVGVRVIFRTAEFADYLDLLADGAGGLFRFGWAAEYPTPDDALRPLFHSSSVVDGSEEGRNYGGYADDEVDALLDAARATLDDDARLALLHRAEDVVLGRDVAVVPLFTYRDAIIISDRVEGFAVDPTGLVDLSSIVMVDS